MDYNQELHQGLGEFVKNRIPVIALAVTVTAVDEANEECDCIDGDGQEYYGVRLRASTANSGLYFIPTANSEVLIANIGNSSMEYAVIGFTSLDKFKLQINALEFQIDADAVIVKKGLTEYQIDSNGFLIKKGGEDLKKILIDLITAISVLTVTCTAPGSPSSPPINVAQLQGILPRLNNLLK